MCPHLGRIVRSFIVIVQRGCDQSMDILLMSWWLSKWESAVRSNWSGVFMLVGSMPPLIINSFHLEGASVSAEELQDIFVCIH